MIGEDLKISEVEGKWEGIEEAYKPILVMVVLHLNVYLLALVGLTEDQAPSPRQLRAKRQSVTYLMVDAISLGFESVL